MSYWLRANVAHLSHIPFSYKILLVNCALTALLSVVGALVAIQHVHILSADPHFDLVALALAAGIVVSFVVDSMLLRLILTPLDRLVVAVDNGNQGKQHPIALGRMSDERLDRLAAGFNRMQNTMEDNA